MKSKSSQLPVSKSYTDCEEQTFETLKQKVFSDWILIFFKRDPIGIFELTDQNKSTSLTGLWQNKVYESVDNM